LAIGEGTLIDGAIVDKNCRIGRRVVIQNERQFEDGISDDQQCLIRDRIPILVKGSRLSDGWTLRLRQP
jgi:glucose-1-phosphate adenylyltransferase